MNFIEFKVPCNNLAQLFSNLTVHYKSHDNQKKKPDDRPISRNSDLTVLGWGPGN